MILIFLDEVYVFTPMYSEADMGFVVALFSICTDKAEEPW